MTVNIELISQTDLVDESFSIAINGFRTKGQCIV